MRSAKFTKLRYEDFPLKLFYYLLSSPPRVPQLFLGKKKWTDMVQRWEEEDASLEASRLLEDQKRTALPLMKAQKASIAIRWVLQTAMDRKPILEEAGLPWRKDIKEQVEVLETYIKKNHAQYENNMLQLKATQEQQNQESANTFTIEDAIATLNLAGFTIADPNKLTIGQFKAMNRAIQKNGKRAA